MTEVTAWTPSVRPRDLTSDDLRQLDRLRVTLARVVDRTQPRAVSWLWDRTLGERAGGPAPAGFVEAVAAAAGDLLTLHLPDVRWAVWPGPRGPTLGVASAGHPMAPVLPFLDAEDRWRQGAHDWLHDYLARAAAHLAAARPAAAHPAAAPATAHLAAAHPATLPATAHLAAARPAAVPATAHRHEAPGPVAPTPAPVPQQRHIAPEDRHAEAERPVPASPVPAPPDLVPMPAAAPVPTRSATPALPPAPPAATTPVAPPTPLPPAIPTEPLETFARDTLEHAMALLRDTGAFDGDVLVVLVGPDGRRTDCCSGQTAEALVRARELVRTSGAQRAALVWVERNPAVLPGPPQRFPAVVVDAWDGGAVSVRLAHRFVDDVLGTDPIGEVLPVGPAYPLR